jgi:hypothetical protein
MVNAFSTENLRLSQEAQELSVRVFCLKEAEERLKTLTKDQNLNVKNLCDLVAKNQKIIQEKKKLMRSDLAEELISFVLQADEDESGDFDDKEIKILLGYIKTLPAIKVNEKRLKRAIEQGRSLSAVLDLVKDISQYDIPAEDRIFIINEEDKELQKELSQRKSERIMSTDRESFVTRFSSWGASSELPTATDEVASQKIMFSSGGPSGGIPKMKEEEETSKRFSSGGHSSELSKTSESEEVEKERTKLKLQSTASTKKMPMARVEVPLSDSKGGITGLDQRPDTPKEIIENVESGDEQQKTARKSGVLSRKIFRKSATGTPESKKAKKKKEAGRTRSLSPKRGVGGTAAKIVKKLSRLGSSNH